MSVWWSVMSWFGRKKERPLESNESDQGSADYQQNEENIQRAVNEMNYNRERLDLLDLELRMLLRAEKRNAEPRRDH